MHKVHGYHAQINVNVTPNCRSLILNSNGWCNNCKRWISRVRWINVNSIISTEPKKLPKSKQKCTNSLTIINNSHTEAHRQTYGQRYPTTVPDSPFFGTAEQLLCWKISLTARQCWSSVGYAPRLRYTRVNSPARGTAAWWPAECRKQHQIWGVFLSIVNSRVMPRLLPARHTDFTMLFVVIASASDNSLRGVEQK